MAGGISHWYDDKVNRAANRETIRILEKACVLVTRSVKESMREPKSGKEYRKPSKTTISGGKVRRTKGATWIASAPGEAPSARHTGNLISSIAWDVGEEGGQLIGRVGTLGETEGGRPLYALYLELGTANMKPRPYLRPTLEKNAAEIQKMFDSRKL